MPNGQMDAKSAAAEALDNLRRKLLDLSKRNRLLNYRPTRASTVPIVGERPVDIFRILWTDEKAMQFAAAGTTAAAEEDPEPGDVDDDASLPVTEAYAPGAPSEEHHIDLVLQTPLTPERLDHNLRRLAEQSRQVEEDTGVSTLFLALGMLEYLESADSSEVRRAPLLLLPVRLERTSARAAWKLRARDDDPSLNASLIEYLRHAYGISLPDLPEESDRIDIDALFAAIQGAVGMRDGWRLTNDAVLALFSFQKFVMFKDLEKNREVILDHKLFRQLATGSAEGEIGLPDELKTRDLDTAFPPEMTHQVVDSDSSQQRALAAAAEHLDLVIEGPPGTGKSQTITNLIAQALGQRKSVLFVAEKMAALAVVHDRLKAARLAPYCLEAHSTKGNKRAVMADIAAALDASLAADGAAPSSGRQLAGLRAELTAYAKALHTPQGPLGWTPFRAFGEFAALTRATDVPWQGGTDGVTESDLDAARSAMRELARTTSTLGDLRTHPWRDADVDYLTAEDRRALAGQLQSLRTLLADVQAAIATVIAATGLPRPRTLTEAIELADLAAVLRDSPGVATEVLVSDHWNAAPAEAVAIIATGKRHSALRAEWRRCMSDAAFQADLAPDLRLVDRLAGHWWRMFSAEYRATRRRWRSWRVGGWTPTMTDQAAALRHVQEWQGLDQWLAKMEASAKALFGAHWQGAQSDWDALDSYVHWIVRYRGECLRRHLTAEAAEFASHRHPNVAAIDTMAQLAQATQAAWQELGARLHWPTDYWSDRSIDELAQRAEALISAPDRLAGWTQYVTSRRAGSGTVGRQMFGHLESGAVAADDLEDVMLRSFLQAWLDDVVGNRPELRNFHGDAHEQRVADFRRLDEMVLQENRRAVATSVRQATQHALATLQGDPSWQFLRTQLTRQKGHAPLRKTLLVAHDAIRAIKPCFLMSPLSVAQFLDPKVHQFDLVIFDEASQLTSEDAVGAVVRGRQTIVVGDPKQLPPTNFFAVQSGQQLADAGDDGAPVYDDLESVLEHCLAAGVRKTRLRWHYRSRHESLIAFSNRHFYGDDLLTFPSADRDRGTRGVQFTFVADGLYEGKGLNRAEARAVADAVVAYARTDPQGSLAVGTFNLRQQIAIQDELERRRRDDPSLEPFFAPRPDGFFVRNLENIQGDERDVILLSVTYGRDANGLLRHNFGPISGRNGARRLNVLVSRARERMHVFSSMRADDIDLRKVSGEGGARLLRDFLAYAERGEFVEPVVAAGAEPESPFEREVRDELYRRGVELVPQVGMAGYRIDFGVIDPAHPGRFICGIECDGATYHSSETARDRDRLRQQVLERLGWRLIRVWSTDWFKDPGAQADRLIRYIDSARRLDAAPVPRREVEGSAAEDDGPAPAATGPTTHAVGSQPIVFAPYRFFEGPPRSTTGVVGARWSDLIAASTEVVRVEGPMHTADLASRVAALFGDQRVGSRIRGRINDAIGMADQKGLVRKRGDFVWGAFDDVTPRSRDATGIPGDRIPPEEVREGVIAVAQAGPRLREKLVSDVAAAFGYGRTGNIIEDAIVSVLDDLIRDGVLGVSSVGLQLRKQEVLEG